MALKMTCQAHSKGEVCSEDKLLELVLSSSFAFERFGKVTKGSELKVQT